jgi:hypothetical protein
MSFTMIHTQIEKIEQRMHPKSAHTHDNSGDVHEMLVEVDNWDLRVHHRETTLVQNLTQAGTVSCITPVLVRLGGLHIGVLGTLL